jgi:hypothetical protein
VTERTSTDGFNYAVYLLLGPASWQKRHSFSPMAQQPNLGLGHFNPPPPSISILCQPSSVLAF